MRRFLEFSLLALAFAVLFFSPLPLGAVTHGWRHLFLGLVFLMLLLWTGLYLVSPARPELGVSRYSLLLLFVILCLLQILPLPGFILGVVSPKSLELWRENTELLDYLGEGGRRSFYTVSLYPHATWRDTLLLLAYFCFGFVIARNFTTRRRVLFLLGGVFAVSLIETGMGIAQYVAPRHEHMDSAQMVASGTYVNKNHYAGFLEMTAPLVLGYAVYLGGWMKGKGFSLKGFISTDNWGKQLIVLFLLGLMFLALVLSKSRTGIVSFLLALVFFYVCTAAVRGSAGVGGVKSSGYALVLFLFIGLCFGLWIGLYPVFEHFLRASGDAPGRIFVWKDTLGQVRDFPLLGSGLGTFRYVYPLYRSAMDDPAAYRYAHNDYLQLLSETGIAGFAVLMAALVLWMRSSLKRLLSLGSRRESLRVSIAIGAITGVVSLLLHSFADFNLHTPANGLYFSFLVGIAHASLFGEPGGRGERSPQGRGAAVPPAGRRYRPF